MTQQPWYAKVLGRPSMLLDDDGPVLLRLRINIEGGFHGIESPRRGDVVEVDGLSAARYLVGGIAQPEWEAELGQPYEPWRAAKRRTF